MNLPQCFTVLFTIALLSVPSECKVKKLKAVAKIFKAKMLLKPLLKTGIFKLPMVHFVIPIQKPGGNGLQGLLGSTNSQSSKGGSSLGRVRCTISQTPCANPMLGIPGKGCQQNGGVVGKNSPFPMLDFSSLPRLNLGGLFGVGGNDCNPTTNRNPKNCREYKQAGGSPNRPMVPYQGQEAASWRPVYSPTGTPPTMLDMSAMADFGNLSMDEFMAMGKGQQPRRGPVHHEQPSVKGQSDWTVQWSTDQGGHLMQTGGHGTVTGNSHQTPPEPIEQTQYNSEDSSEQEAAQSPTNNQEPTQQRQVPY